MTGGVIPLAATLATSAVFDSFIGDSKVFGRLITFCQFRVCYSYTTPYKPPLHF